MRTLLIPAAAAAILATSAFAFAAAQHATGTIKAYDSKAMTLTFADGFAAKDVQESRPEGRRKGLGQLAKERFEKIADQVTIVK